VNRTNNFVRSAYPMLKEVHPVERMERVALGPPDREVARKNDQATVVERRQYPRDGVVREIENITYSALRRYGLLGEVAQQGFITETAL